MRIGIDCRTILNPRGGEKAGVGHYTYYLVKNLLKIDQQNEYVLFFDSSMIETNEFEKKNVEIRFFPFFQYKRYLPYAYSHILISANIAKENLNLYHNPSGIIPLNYKGKSIITIHDLAIYKNPNWFPQRLLSRNVFFTRVLIPSSIKKAEKIIAISENTKKDIVSLFKVKPEKVQVTYLGVEEEKISQSEIKKALKKFNLKNPYILFLGTIEPRKNIVILIKAFEKLITSHKQSIGNLQLIIAGPRGWKYQNVFKTIEKSKVKEQIRYLGYVTHQQKVTLIKKATCFVFPTLYEGFGLPVLEAMSLGTPVITSDISSLPEVTEKAAILVNPKKETEITKVLEKLLKDKNLQKKLAQRGALQAKKFLWQNTAKETLKLYQSLK